MKVLVICLGNICRSPLGEGILHHHKPNTDWHIDSAGIGNWHVGSAPDNRSIKVAMENGIDISSQKTRQITQDDFNTFDFILVMEPDQIEILERNYSKGKAQVKLITEWAHPNENIIVPDPYYGEQKDFSFAFNLLEKSCLAFIRGNQ